MCGLIAITGDADTVEKLQHRGPDSHSELYIGNVRLLFWRLAINGLTCGQQPFQHGDKYLIANAEIYNHEELGGEKGHSDCEVILKLIKRYGLTSTCQMLNGDFAFVLTDGKEVWAARDRFGVRPLFFCKHSTGVAFASEAKALIHFGTRIVHFPPGHLYDSGRFICWERNHWDMPKNNQSNELWVSIVAAVERRIRNTEVPVGYFLSGGLDSSIIAAVGKSLSKDPIKTFSIGLKDSPDLLAARQMSTFLDSDHTEVIFKPDEGIAVIGDVIWHLETYDTTTVRASIPMYLLSKYIKENTDIRVILSGEGSDEIFGGYLYFHGAPDSRAFDKETERLVNDVHMFDVLRADRTTAAWGLELRVPFFDTHLVNYVMKLSSELKMPRDGYEKWILRKTFEHMLPRNICWRQKNGMSDAVGTDWRQALKNFGEFHYKDIYADYFGNQHHLVPYMWMPKWSDATDPSATELKYFKAPDHTHP
jgi:asparagine synthase (glutamine-hydrolysing)